MSPYEDPSDSLYLVRRARCGEMYGLSEEEVDREMKAYMAEVHPRCSRCQAFVEAPGAPCLVCPATPHVVAGGGA